MDKSVNTFYNSKGWLYDSEGNFLDALAFEDLRKCSYIYLKNNRLRLMKYFPNKGDLLLDCASGPIQYAEYLEYSKNYNKRICVDLSKDALDIAKSRDPEKIETIHGNILNLNLGSKKFKSILCIHTLYHIQKKHQSLVINKFKNHIESDGTILIIYSNPNFLLEKIKKIFKVFRSKDPEFTFERLTISEVKIAFPKAELIPFRFLSGEDMRRILPNNKITKIILVLINWIEPLLPLFLVQYYLIRFENNLKKIA